MANKPIAKRKPWQPEPSKPFARNRSFAWFYNSSRWRKVSKVFREANPLCVECEKVGKVSSAKVADHKIGLGYLIDNNLDPYDHNELQALCSSCHNKKSGSEAHNSRAYRLNHKRNDL